jgi:sterol desaturase/sphingolipid hydroxylase (fatty acid hydroxylase superfamily)
LGIIEGMEEALFANEPSIRLGFFGGILIVMALWEALAPRRKQIFRRRWRWPNNLGLVVLNTIVLRFAFPTAAVGFAVVAQTKGWGLLNTFDISGSTAFVIAVILLDLSIYFQHVLFHAVPILWRLHRLHHADLEFDVTTGLRFHPLEIILSMLIKFMVIAALGPSAAAVLIFEIVLNGTAMFNHGNVRMPAALDALIRLVVVTPDMHRVHHSITPHETNSNFGFSVPWWDRLFGTYRAQPEKGHLEMEIGIEQFRTAADLRLDRQVIQPLRGSAITYPINRNSAGE